MWSILESHFFEGTAMQKEKDPSAEEPCPHEMRHTEGAGFTCALCKQHFRQVSPGQFVPFESREARKAKKTSSPAKHPSRQPTPEKGN